MSILSYCIWGMPGSGKSRLYHTIKLNPKFSLPAYDLDLLVKKVFPDSLIEFNHFLESERHLIQWCEKLSYPHILCCGGSTPMRYLEKLKNRYFCIWINLEIKLNYFNFSSSMPRLGLEHITHIEEFETLYKNRMKNFQQAHAQVPSWDKALDLII